METTNNHGRMAGLLLGALGVVYGDIGTSPLYTIKECFFGPHGMALTPEHVLGVLSMILWSLVVVVSLKYVVFIMRADNNGEGGILALMALTQRILGASSRWRFPLVMLAVFGAALFYGDSMITPAISVLSAAEGLKVIAPGLESWVLPLTILILFALFLIQRFGTASVGKLFGPIMIAWFAVLMVMGLYQIVKAPEVLAALSPHYALRFIWHDPWLAFMSLGAVVLAFTGGEALYADMGHFGKLPIRWAWFYFVLPALVINYFGQGALLLSNPAAVANPFFMMAPKWGLVPLLVLATFATVIASQAVISGAYSVSSSAVQLGFSPRMRVLHTSAREMGQIYVPAINWALLVSVLILVVGYRSSSNLAAAYGIAVTGTMVITTILAFVVMRSIWKKKHDKLGLFLLGCFLLVDLLFFSSNALKILHGGWFPLVIGLMIFTLMTTWKRGREILVRRLSEDAMPLDVFLGAISDGSPIRVPGTAVFMTSSPEGVPHAMLHNLKHNKVLHEKVYLLTVVTEDVPVVPSIDRAEIHALGKEFYRMTVRYGFKEEPDIPLALAGCAEKGHEFDMMDTSFFVSRETVISTDMPGMAVWREKLFATMARNAQRSIEFFKIPPNRVVELGAQVEI